MPKVDRRHTNKGRVENLTPFPKGVSGNPGGRPKVLGEAYREWLAKFDPETGLTRAQGVAMAMGKAALSGKVDAAREIWRATESARIEVTGADGGAIQVQDIEQARLKRWERVAPMLAKVLESEENNESGHA